MTRQIVGLDLGSARIRTLITDATVDGHLRVRGFGDAPSRGIRNGVVVNTSAAVEATTESINAAGVMAGSYIDEVFIGVAGSHTRTLVGHGFVDVPDETVTQDDVRRVVEAAVASSEAGRREILHIAASRFVCGGQGGVDDPIGFRTASLGVEVRIVATLETTLRDSVNIAHRAGLEVADAILKPHAAAEATVTPDEKDMGCVLVDVGGGETSLSIYRNGALEHAAAVRIGAGRLTRDVAVVYRMPEAEAERIKKAYGSASAGSLEAPSDVEFESAHFGSYGTRTMNPGMLTEVLEPRATEIVEFVQETISAAGCRGALGAGVILTGGGAHQRGFPELIGRLLELPVRIGTPTGDHASRYRHPEYATLLGLVACGEKKTRPRPRNWVGRVRRGLGL